MKNFILGALASTAALTMAAPANAAAVMAISGSNGTFGNADVSGNFADTFSILGAAGYTIANLTISSSTPTLDFSSVTFNGTEFNTVQTGTFEYRNLGPVPLLASNTLNVSGTAPGTGSYSGTIQFSAPNAVPEPATWAMMLVGFGAVGYGMRRKAKISVVRTQAA